MTFRVEVTATARRSLRRIGPPHNLRIDALVQSLADNPYPQGAVKLKGEERRWRIRTGRFRIIYDVYTNLRTVEVMRITRRSESTYRNL